MINRTPSKSVDSFFTDFTSLIEALISKRSSCIITGDLNIRVDSPEPSTNKFNIVLESFDLVKHVNSPTHIAVHTLDLVITHRDSNIITHTPVIEDLISDHFAVSFTIAAPRPKAEPTTVTKRNLKNIDFDQFKKDIENSALLQNPANDLTELVNQYNKCLNDILDNHAPKQRHAWYSKFMKIFKKRRL